MFLTSLICIRLLTWLMCVSDLFDVYSSSDFIDVCSSDFVNVYSSSDLLDVCFGLV